MKELGLNKKERKQRLKREVCSNESDLVRDAEKVRGNGGLASGGSLMHLY